MTATVGPLEVGETKAVRFDFSTEASSGSTLSLPSVTCAVMDGTDLNPSAVLAGSPVVSGQEVVQLVTPGVAGCTYKLRAFATDSTGQRHAINAYLKVVPG